MSADPFVEHAVPPRPRPDAGFGACCAGAAYRGPDGCTCWEPIYDRPQAELDVGRAEVRTSMCDGCAFRPGTDADLWRRLYDEAGPDMRAFYCHGASRAVIGWRHPSGVEISHGEPEHDPPVVDGAPYDTDGQPSPICAGWAARFTS